MKEQSSDDPPLGFWKRQFSLYATQPQIIFDVVIGMALPILCFVLDPLVFKVGGVFGVWGQSPFLGNYRILAYFFSGLNIILLGYWLLQQNHLTKSSDERPLKSLYYALPAGVFFAGAAFCFLIGIVILPFSLFGLLFGIGVLGFSPFVIGLVYLRNASRSKKHGDIRFPAGLPTLPLLAGILLPVLIPMLVQFSINQITDNAINAIVQGDQHSSRSGVYQLNLLRFAGADTDRLVWAYEKAPDNKKAQIAACYYELTQQDIAQRLMRLRD